MFLTIYNGICQIPSVHIGHDDIGDQQMHNVLLSNFYRLSGRSSDNHAVAQLLQERLAEIQDQWFVGPQLTVTAGVRYEYLNNPNAPILNQFDSNANGSTSDTTFIW